MSLPNLISAHKRGFVALLGFVILVLSLLAIARQFQAQANRRVQVANAAYAVAASHTQFSTDINRLVRFRNVLNASGVTGGEFSVARANFDSLASSAAAQSRDLAVLVQALENEVDLAEQESKYQQQVAVIAALGALLGTWMIVAGLELCFNGRGGGRGARSPSDSRAPWPFGSRA